MQFYFKALKRTIQYIYSRTAQSHSTVTSRTNKTFTNQSENGKTEAANHSLVRCVLTAAAEVCLLSSGVSFTLSLASDLIVRLLRNAPFFKNKKIKVWGFLLLAYCQFTASQSGLYDGECLVQVFNGACLL